MRLVLLSLVLCVSTLAAAPRRVIQPKAKNKLTVRPRSAKSKRTFHPLGLLRRLGNAESELALRLSSCGIPRQVENTKPPAGTSQAQPELASDPQLRRRKKFE